MEEESKSLTDKVGELTEQLNQLTGGKKKSIKIPFFCWLIGLIFGGLGFTISSLYLDITYSIAVALGIFLLALFICIKLSNERLWQLPFKYRNLSKSKKRKGYVVFMNVGLNKAITFTKAPIEEGVAMVNGTPHVVSPKDILLWKNKVPIVFNLNGVRNHLVLKITLVSLEKLVKLQKAGNIL